MRGHDNGMPRMLSPQEAADVAGGLTEDDLEAGRLESLCVRWVADEAKTLTEASLMLRDFAGWLLELELDLVDHRLGRAQLGDARDHREHDLERAVRRRPQPMRSSRTSFATPATCLHSKAGPPFDSLA